MISNGRSNRSIITLQKGPFKVLVSLVTLWSFLFSTVSYDLAWAARTPLEPTAVSSNRAGSLGFVKELNVANFTLPEYLGSIKDSWSSKGKETIIHIQDAHCNYYAQHKIVEIVEYLNKEYGVNTINLEGGAKGYDLSMFTDIADNSKRAKASDYFVKEGLVNGSEYFAINNPEKVNLWGVEDTDLYIANLNAYRNSLKHKDEIDKNLNALTHILNTLKTNLYSQELLELDIKYSQYKAGSLEFKDYLAYLVKTAKNTKIGISKFSNICLLNQALGAEGNIDFRNANNQRDNLIDKLQKKLSKRSLEELVLKTIGFKSEKISQKEFYAYLTNKAILMGMDLKDYPEFQKYVAYISMHDAIDKMKIMEEMDSLENSIKETLWQNDKQKELDKLSKNLTLTKNIFNISMTRDDYKFYKENEGSFGIGNYVKFINREAPLYKITAQLDDNISMLDQYREDMARFYEYSLARDQAFLKNLKFSQASSASIIVTGGFHTESLSELFKKNNISYITIMPNFKNQTGYECPYFKLLSGEKSLEIKEVLPAVLKQSLAIPDPLNPEIKRAMIGVTALGQTKPLTLSAAAVPMTPPAVAPVTNAWSYPPKALLAPLQSDHYWEGVPQHAVYAIGENESYDDIVVKELAKKKGVSVDDLEADFERTVTMLEERMKYSGFIEPGEDATAKKIHEIFDRLIKVYQTQTQEAPGAFHIVDSNTVNAFVIRKRTDVYFYKGLYETLYDISTRMNAPLTEDMIAFIIAHELSHALQHTSHQGLDVQDLKESVSPYLIQMIKNGEYDADMRALELMDKAGYSVFGAVDAMTFLEFITGSSQAENVLSSHPYVSLRKHRLSQIIFDQKTNVFTNVKAPRTPMVGAGRMKSQDVDFRYLMNKSEEDLLTMAQRAENITVLDELTGMFITRKKMNELKTLVNEDYLKTSFLRHVYMQAVLSAIVGSRVNLMHEPIDYRFMEGAAAIYNFGMYPATNNILRIRTDIFEEDIGSIIEKSSIAPLSTDSEEVSNAKSLFQSLSSVVKGKGEKLDHNDFDGFLLSPEEVKDLIPLFTEKTNIHGIPIDKNESIKVDRKQISDAIRNPRKLISAFFYAKYLGQEPSVEFGIPTIDMSVKLQRRNNEIYLKNPAYRDIQSPDARKKLQDIVLLHYVMERTNTKFGNNIFGPFSGYINMPEVSQEILSEFFLKYHSLLSKKYPSPVAINLALERVHKYLGVDINNMNRGNRAYSITHSGDTLIGFNDEVQAEIESMRSSYKGSPDDLDNYVKAQIGNFIDNHKLIIFIKDSIKKYSGRIPIKKVQAFETEINQLKGSPRFSYWHDFTNILTEIARVYSQEPQREIGASDVFKSETTLDYYLEEGDINSLESLLSLPDWAVSDYLNRKRYNANNLIEDALKEGTPLNDIFTFMKSRLSYDDRTKVFANLFLGYHTEPTYLFNFFKTTFNNNPQEIILWFLGMFSNKDALGLIDDFCCKCLYERIKNTDNIKEVPDFKKLTIALLEYIYSHTSKTFHASPESAKVYLDLIKDRIEESGKAGDRDYMLNAAYNALMILSASTDLYIKLSCPKGVSPLGSPDFKSENTSIVPAEFSGDYASYESKFALHNFGWNDEKPADQSAFITCLPDLSIEQLKQLLTQRLRYIQSKSDVEYKGETFSPSTLDDSFANLITLMILKKMHKPDWAKTKEGVDKLDELIRVSVSYKHSKGYVEVISTNRRLRIIKDDINAVPYRAIKDDLVGIAVPSSTLESVWEAYIVANNIQGSFPEIIPLLQNPNVGNEYVYNPTAFLEKHTYGDRISYRQVVKRFFMNSSVYARLFNAYCKLHGKGYVYGKYRPLEERLEWAKMVLPHKSIIKDSIIDLWETDIFPEIIAGMPALVKLARQVSGEGEELSDVWTLLGEMDDDVGRLKRLNDQISLSPERIHQLLGFYEAIIPLVLSPQKISRYGATSYMLWKQLPENANLGLSENLDALTKFMPEPSVLRDELLMKLANRYARHLEDAPRICEKLYSNNLLSRNKDLRTEDFVSETLLHLFGAAKIEDRRDILLWMVGAIDKPRFVTDVENKYRVDFTTLPDDVKLLPLSMREKFIEGFMLGDNGVLDPQSDNDRLIMSDFLERLFLYIFPEGTKGMASEDRVLLSKVFLVVMKSFPPYRRVQVIKALAAMRVRADFEKTSTGERLSVLLGVMGPVGIKVAQYLSENETLVPDDSIRSSLGSLRNKAPEITKISACSALENEVPLSEVLVREIGEPVGVASIKQVNRGKWLDIKALAELVIQKASRADADEVREKLRAYDSEGIITPEVAAYVVEKARYYKVDLEDATVSVVFKIRRPNMETTLGIDFAALDAVARELEGASHKGETLNIGDLVQTVKDWVTLEKNFRNEVKFHNMLTGLDYAWAADLEKQANVTIAHPRVLYATDSLIVEEEMQGVPVLNLAQRQQPITMEDVVDAGYTRTEAERIFNRLTKVDPRQANIVLSLKKAGFSEESLSELAGKMLAYDYEKLRELLRHMLLRQIFVDGIFHADLHQGNVLVTPEGKIVMIDRGNVGMLNKEQIEGAKILLKGLSLREKELIKQGIDLIFLHAQYPKGIQPTTSRVTMDDIKETLDKGYDLKMTMNVISVKAVQGAKNTPGGKDFSTFLKAFTQAMYLFPTDMSNGMATLQAISQYISMSKEETERAAQEQAKYFIVKSADTEAGKGQAQEVDIIQIAKKLFYEKTAPYFMSSVWQSMVFHIMEIPIRTVISKISYTNNNMMTLVRVYGRQFIEDHIDEFVKKQDSEISDAVKDIMSVQYAERLLTSYIERCIEERFWGRLCAPVAIPLFKNVLFLARPFTEIFIEATREWIGVTGKRYVANIAPKMTVREAINLLSQVFGEDFADIKKKFDEREKANPVRSTSATGKLPSSARLAPFPLGHEWEGSLPAESQLPTASVVTLARDGEVLRMLDRDVVVVVLPSGKEQAFYRSTGQNSHMPGRWFPFDGISPNKVVGTIAWFSKDRYSSITLQKRNPGLYKYGTEELRQAGEHLDKMHLAIGEEVTEVRKINNFIGSDTSRAFNKIYDGIDKDRTEGNKVNDEVRRAIAKEKGMILPFAAPAPVAVPAEDAVARKTTTVEAFTSSEGKDNDVKVVVGVPVDMNKADVQPTLSTINRDLAKSGFGRMEDNKQVITFEIDVADPVKTTQNQEGAVRKAKEGLSSNGRVILFAPQMEKGPQLAGKAQETYKGEGNVTVIPDAYTDSNPDKNIYPDIMVRVALGRNIAFYYTGKDPQGTLAIINSLLAKVADGFASIATIDDLLNLLKPLRIRPIDYKIITEWQKCQEAVATAL